MTIFSNLMLRLGYVRMSDIGLKRLNDGSLISVSEPTAEMTTRLAEPDLFSGNVPSSNNSLSNPALLLEASRPAQATRTTHEVLVSGHAPAQAEPQNSNQASEPVSRTIQESPSPMQATAASIDEDTIESGSGAVSPRQADDITAVDHDVESEEDWEAKLALARARQELEAEATRKDESEADWDAVIAKAREAAA